MRDVNANPHGEAGDDREARPTLAAFIAAWDKQHGAPTREVDEWARQQLGLPVRPN